MFFVSVASKGVSFFVSLLFATLAGRFISVADKGVKEIVSSGKRGVASLESYREAAPLARLGEFQVGNCWYTPRQFSSRRNVRDAKGA